MIKKIILLVSFSCHLGSGTVHALSPKHWAAGSTLAALLAGAGSGTLWAVKRRARLRALRKLRRNYIERAVRSGDKNPDARHITIAPSAIEQFAQYLLWLAAAGSAISGASWALLAGKTPPPPSSPQASPAGSPVHGALVSTIEDLFWQANGEQADTSAVVAMLASLNGTDQSMLPNGQYVRRMGNEFWGPSDEHGNPLWRFPADQVLATVQPPRPLPPHVSPVLPPASSLPQPPLPPHVSPHLPLVAPDVPLPQPGIGGGQNVVPLSAELQEGQVTLYNGEPHLVGMIDHEKWLYRDEAPIIPLANALAIQNVQNGGGSTPLPNLPPAPATPPAPVIPDDVIAPGASTSRFDDLRVLLAGAVVTLYRGVGGGFVGEFAINADRSITWQTPVPVGHGGEALGSLNELNNKLFHKDGAQQLWRAQYHGISGMFVVEQGQDIALTEQLRALNAGDIVTAQEGSNRLAEYIITLVDDVPMAISRGDQLTQSNGTLIQTPMDLLVWRHDAPQRRLVYQGNQSDVHLRVELPPAGAKLDGTARYYELLRQNDRLRIIDTSGASPVVIDVTVGPVSSSWSRKLSDDVNIAGTTVSTTKDLYDALFPESGITPADGRLVFARANTAGRQARPGFSIIYNPAPIPSSAIIANTDQRFAYLKEGGQVGLISRIDSTSTPAAIGFDASGLPQFRTSKGQVYSVDDALASFVIDPSAEALLAQSFSATSPQVCSNRSGTLKAFGMGMSVVLANGTTCYYLPAIPGTFTVRRQTRAADRVLLKPNMTVHSLLTDIGRGFPGSPPAWGPAAPAQVTFLSAEEVQSVINAA